MRVPKDRYNVNIVCTEDTVVKGVIHVSQGLRISDSLNDSKETFIAVTNVEFFDGKGKRTSKSADKLRRKDSVLFLNKTSIKWIEEIE